MNELTAALKEELNVDTAFTLPIFGGIDIPESIAVSWGIMAFLVIVSILLTRNLKVNHISKRQAILETAVVTMDNFFKDLLGEAGKQYVPYLITVALYIARSSWRPHCSTQATARLSTLACRFPVSAALPRPRP